MNKIYNWIIIILFVILFGWVIISNERYNNLESKYIEQMNKDAHEVDSLQKEILKSEEKIQKLTFQLTHVSEKLDSLYNIKQEIKNEVFVFSNSVSESAQLLKDNLQCVTF